MSLQIALVEYLNTLPFSAGMKITGFDQEHKIHRVPPATCASLFKEGEVDISLCPVGALDEMPPHEIVGKYCIGADGPVSTVMLLSQVPLNQIESIRLDPHSRTSNILLQILAKRYWQESWNYYIDEKNTDAESCLMIGDKVFEQVRKFPYHYDLAQAWQELTGKPMVFAVWIAKPGVSTAIIEAINESFEKGMKSIKAGEQDLKPWQLKYLTKNISYPFDDSKKRGLALFREWSPAPVSSVAGS